ncbi:class I SAM-dependent methyltransferase [Campylobacter fetus]|nr:class I SAM-dependent methyltransferase [Campylobacter fetus]
MVKSIIYNIKNCRICSNPIEKVLELRKSPLGDAFYKDKQLAKKYELLNVDLCFCTKCNQIQLSQIIEPNEIYTENYLYKTSISIGLREHFKKSAKEIIEETDINKGFVVEIGSNEGFMLEAFKNKKFEVLGIDPATPATNLANSRGINTINKFFTYELVKQIIQEYKSADIILANNVFANIPDINSIMQAVSELLNNNGVFVIETSYALSVLQNNLIDTIYHEHISYLTLTSISNLSKMHELRVFKSSINNSKGGSLRVYICKENAKFKNTPDLENILNNEKKLFLDKNLFINFTERLNKFKLVVQNLATEIKLEEKLCIYGASMGCIMMCEQFELGEKIDYLIDDNELKIGKFSPSRAIEVKSSEFLLQLGVKNVINFAWRFCEPIKQKNIKFLENGGTIYNINLKDLRIDKICL